MILRVVGLVLVFQGILVSHSVYLLVVVMPVSMVDLMIQIIRWIAMVWLIMFHGSVGSEWNGRGGMIVNAVNGDVHGCDTAGAPPNPCTVDGELVMLLIWKQSLLNAENNIIQQETSLVLSLLISMSSVQTGRQHHVSRCPAKTVKVSVQRWMTRWSWDHPTRLSRVTRIRFQLFAVAHSF